MLEKYWRAVPRVSVFFIACTFINDTACTVISGIDRISRRFTCTAVVQLLTTASPPPPPISSFQVFAHPQSEELNC